MTAAVVTKQMKVNRAEELLENTAQTMNARRVTGVGRENSDVESIWLGKVFTEAGEVSDPHHHGHVETAGYVLEGEAYIRTGELFQDIVYLKAGDFLYVPPGTPHIEGNRSKTKKLVWLTARESENVVVNLKGVEVADIEIDMVP